MIWPLNIERGDRKLPKIIKEIKSVWLTIFWPPKKMILVSIGSSLIGEFNKYGIV
jgi:hypothetical protein